MNKITTFLIIILTALTASLSAQSLEFREDLLDVGLTQWYHPVTATYTFTNVSDQPLTIQYVDPGCGCMEPEWTRGMIQPGASGRVTVTYNAEMLGRFDRMIEVKNSIDGEPQLVRMKCKVVDHEVVRENTEQDVDEEEDDPVDEPVVTNTPAVIDYSKPVMLTSTSSLIIGKYKPNKKMKGTVVITNRGDGMLLVERIETSDALIADFSHVALKKGQTYKIRVWLDTSKISGPDDSQQFVIVSNDQIAPRKTIKVIVN
jgi:hypothetical protein